MTHNARERVAGIVAHSAPEPPVNHHDVYIRRPHHPHPMCLLFFYPLIVLQLLDLTLG